MCAQALPFSYFSSHDTLSLAKDLLGRVLVHETEGGVTSGIIVETEAYLADDPACHAYQRRTPRTEPMYAQAGTIYVYQIYGMYQCVNVVSNVEGIGEAVLIRALQPVQGIELMQLRRKLAKKLSDHDPDLPLRELCRGPGKLVIAMGIDKTVHNGLTFPESHLYITSESTAAEASKAFEIASGTRIGLSVGTSLPYRFFISGNKFVSK